MSSRERMTKVLGCLVLSVTAGAVILRLLQPVPLVDLGGFSLSAAFPIQQVFQTHAPLSVASWNRIVIYQSGTLAGNAQTLDEYSRQQGQQELIYHFVISNGHGAPDGRIRVSRHWVEQRDQRELPAANTGDFDAATIRICLIGDFSKAAPGSAQFSKLQALLRVLQQRCQIPPQHVSLAFTPAGAADQWRLFPVQKLRENLLSSTAN